MRSGDDQRSYKSIHIWRTDNPGEPCETKLNVEVIATSILGEDGIASSGIDMYDFIGPSVLGSPVVTLNEFLEVCIGKLVSVGAT